VFGVMADKRAREMLAETAALRAAADRDAARPVHERPIRTCSPRCFQRRRRRSSSNPRSSARSRRRGRSNDAIAVAGSLYLAGEVYRLLDVPIA
jgi:folylpolyglutamate synthase/dihydropteroate synthase